MNGIRALAMQHMGRPVVVHSTYGVHYGVLHHVDDDGIYLQRMRGGQLAQGQAEASVVPLSEQVGNGEAQLAWFPFFFLPWLALAAIGPWGWWW